MTRNRSRRRAGVISLGLAVVLALGATAAGALQDVDERVDAEAEGLVEIDLVSGDLAVEGWDRAEVQVTGTIEDGVERVRVERVGGRVEVEVVAKHRLGLGLDPWGHRVDADLRVRVPQGSDISADAISADVEVRGVTGEVEVDVVSGDIDVDVDSAHMDLETISGDIDLRAGKAEVKAESVSGDLEVRLEEGEVEAETVSGDIDVRVGSLREGDAESVSGDIEFSGGLARRGRLELQSHSGNLEVSLPAGAAVRIDTDTHSGDVRNEYGSDEGDGVASVELTTFSGDIRIRRQQ